MAIYRPSQVIYDAAARWRDRCLLGEGSVFTDESLWNRKRFEDLMEYYVNNLYEGEGSFFTKLEGQLKNAPVDAIKLTSELFWALYLYISPKAMTADTKQSQIKMVWNWSGQEFPSGSQEALDVLGSGIGRPGTAYNTHRWRELMWFIIAMHEWFGKSIAERKKLLVDPWDFASWLDATPKSSGRQFRHIVLHHLFPESFERTITGKHKRQILERIPATVGEEVPDYTKSDRVKIDSELLKLRKKLEPKYGTEFDYYEGSIRDEWQETSTPDAQITDDPVTDQENEKWYQSRFGSGRVWTIGPGKSGERWGEFKQQNLITIGWDYLGDLQDYSSKEQIEASIQTERESEKRHTNDALACYEFAHIMKPGDTVIAKKGRSGLYGYGVITSDYQFDDTRQQHMHVRMVEWKKTGVWELPKEHWITVKALTDFTSYRNWLRKAFAVMDGDVDVDGDVDEYSVDSVAEPVFSYGRQEALQDLFIGIDLFDDIEKAMSRNKAVILTGPPGVGKTFVSQRLAWSFIGARDTDRFQLVQFHQSYTYEDFVQGFKPNSSGGFELKDGIFVKFCKKAAADPDNQYVFVIDEINRANLSKVFGELLMLIETDKRNQSYSVHLSYADSDSEPFFVPENVYILGLMNTADRSLAIVDYALRRRFMFFSLQPSFDSEQFREHLSSSGVESGIIDKIINGMLRLNRIIRDDVAELGPGFEIGHSYFVPRKEDQILDDDWYTSIVKYEIEPLLREYWFDKPGKTEAEIKTLLL